jgi:hypothetical protein
MISGCFLILGESFADYFLRIERQARDSQPSIVVSIASSLRVSESIIVQFNGRPALTNGAQALGGQCMHVHELFEKPYCEQEHENDRANDQGLEDGEEESRG